MSLITTPVAVARRAREFVGVLGPHAGEYLQRMVSNDVLALEPAAACDALLLTPKARVIATLRVLRRAPDDFLLLTEPELGDVVREHLVRMRFGARAEIELERQPSFLLLGSEASPPAGCLAIPNLDYGVRCFEIVGAPEPPGTARLGEEELERLRIEAGTPLFGREIDDRVLPAEAGLEERAISFTKGCYPGQEPVARLHYRGHPNRVLRVLSIETEELPAYDAEILYDGKAVGRVTSAVPVDGGVLALAYVRVEVPEQASLVIQGAPATMTLPERP